MAQCHISDLEHGQALLGLLLLPLRILLNLISQNCTRVHKGTYVFIPTMLTSHRPGPEATMLLTLYDFTHANKLFSSTFVIMPSKNKDDAPPVSSFLSFASYLFQNAYRSSRATMYSYLSFLTLQILVEDTHLVKQICNNDYKIHVRLCRQKPPLLPISKSKRPIACSVLDIIIDTINHNLRRRLDVELYKYAYCLI